MAFPPLYDYYMSKVWNVNILSERLKVQCNILEFYFQELKFTSNF